jgi:putative transposase
MLMGRVFGVGRGGFYAWCNRSQTGPRVKKPAVLDTRAKDTFDAPKARYGAPRVSRELAAQRRPVDKKTVASNLRRQALGARAGWKSKATTNSKHNPDVAPNLLEQDFSAENPNEKWVQDITCLFTGQGWLY